MLETHTEARIAYWIRVPHTDKFSALDKLTTKSSKEDGEHHYQIVAFDAEFLGLAGIIQAQDWVKEMGKLNPHMGDFNSVVTIDTCIFRNDGSEYEGQIKGVLCSHDGQFIIEEKTGCLA